jgi:hypothetical protein
VRQASFANTGPNKLPAPAACHDADVNEPPQLLHWARDTLNGIAALRGQARRGEIELSDEVHALLLHERRA